MQVVEELKDIQQKDEQVCAAILDALLYFDVFSYPLTAHEIRSFSSVRLTDTALMAELNRLLGLRRIFRFGEFYSVKDMPSLEQRRIDGNKLAIGYVRRSVRYSRVIGAFPFVKAVFISGSISKGYATRDSDVDYFVVTAPGRLWLTRTLLIAFKKFFLFNSKKYFCLNYFISADNLAIPDRNRFTATELSTLIPVYGHSVHDELLEHNRWIYEFLPAAGDNANRISPLPARGIFKRSLEWIFSGNMGSRLDRYFMKLTLGRWKKKFPGFDPGDFELNFRSTTSVSKHHPNSSQQRVLSAYEENKQAYAEKHSVIQDS